MLLRRQTNPAAEPTLHWDGTRLIDVPGGTGDAQAVTVTVPLRLVAVRCSTLPAADPAVLRAAVRLRAEREFAVLGPVAVDALIAPPRDGQCAVALVALPHGVLTAIRSALGGRTLARVRIAEFLVPLPLGGVIEVHGARTLVAMSDGVLRGITALGSTPPEAQRLLLGVSEEQPAHGPIAPQIDFVAPTLSARPALFARRGARAAALAAGLLLLLAVAGGLVVRDALAQRQELQEAAERIRPLATVLAAQRADMKELAGWFAERPQTVPVLAILAAALPAAEAREQVRLVRVRLIPGEDAIAEGLAGDRAQMLGFLTRLRQDRRIASAEIRSYRAPTKGATEVTFELVFRIAGGSHAGA